MGGIITVWFGDFFQCEEMEGSPLYEYEPFRMLQVRELQTSVRFSDCPIMVNFIRELRTRNPDIQKLKAWLEECKTRPLQLEYVTLMSTRQEIDKYFRNIVENNDHAVYRACIFSSFENQSFIVKDTVAARARVICREADLEFGLFLYPGLKIMISKNFIIGDLHLRNGMFGEILDLEEDAITVTLEVYPGKTFRLARFAWVCGTTGVHVFQFPIIQALSMTIHRVQSRTLDGVNLYLDKLFSPGQVLSAFGRSRYFKNITVRGNIDMGKLVGVRKCLWKYYDERINK
jgi:hypothetical protein